MKVFDCFPGRNFSKILVVCQIMLPLFVCHAKFHRKRSEPETTTQLGPSQEDKEILKEALHLLNMGKKTLRLSTVNPQQVIQLISNSSSKDTQIQNYLKKPLNDSVLNGEQYMVLTRKNGHLQLVNYTDTTFPPEAIPSNKSVRENLFKLTMEKKYPEKKGKGKLLRKIIIVETNQHKLLDEKELPRHFAISNISRRHHKRRRFYLEHFLPRIRKRRARYVPSKVDHRNIILNDDDEGQDSKYSKNFLESSKVPMHRINLETGVNGTERSQGSKSSDIDFENSPLRFHHFNDQIHRHPISMILRINVNNEEEDEDSKNSKSSRVPLHSANLKHKHNPLHRANLKADYNSEEESKENKNSDEFSENYRDPSNLKADANNINGNKVNKNLLAYLENFKIPLYIISSKNDAKSADKSKDIGNSVDFPENSKDPSIDLKTVARNPEKDKTSENSDLYSETPEALLHRMSLQADAYLVDRNKNSRHSDSYSEILRVPLSRLSLRTGGNDVVEETSDEYLKSFEVPLQIHGFHSSNHFQLPHVPKLDKVQSIDASDLLINEKNVKGEMGQYKKINSKRQYTYNDSPDPSKLAKGNDIESRLLGKLEESDKHRKIESNQDYLGKVVEERRVTFAIHRLLAEEKEFMNRILRMVNNVRSRDGKVRNFEMLLILVLVLVILALSAFIVYRKWRKYCTMRTHILANMHEKKADRFGDKLKRTLRFGEKLNKSLYNAPFNNVYYQIVPNDEEVELDWQLETNEWVSSDQELDKKRVFDCD